MDLHQSGLCSNFGVSTQGPKHVDFEAGTDDITRPFETLVLDGDDLCFPGNLLLCKMRG